MDRLPTVNHSGATIEHLFRLLRSNASQRGTFDFDGGLNGPQIPLIAYQNAYISGLFIHSRSAI